MIGLDVINNPLVMYTIIGLCVVFNFVSLPSDLGNIIKKILGVLLMIGSLYATYGFISEGAAKMGALGATSAVKLQWSIIICIFVPVMVGMCIKGFYAVTGLYDRHAKKAADL
jgi:hypothetical protein